MKGWQAPQSVLFPASNSNIEASQAPQPEHAPVILDILSRSSTPLLTSSFICCLVVPLQWQITSFLYGLISFIACLGFCIALHASRDNDFQV